METLVQSCRIRKQDAELLAKQALQRQLKVSALCALYLKEKLIEEEYGMGFRDSVGGREAYVSGHRLAVWEVVDANEELGSAAATAEHFQLPLTLVQRALAYAEAYPNDVQEQKRREV